MRNRQIDRYIEIERLQSELDGAALNDTAHIIHQMDRLLEEAAAVDGIRAPDEAAAALGIALHALGADPEHPRPEERLVIMAMRFLKTLAAMVLIQQSVMSPLKSNMAISISSMTGLA
jgi:hypothetical protein